MRLMTAAVLAVPLGAFAFLPSWAADKAGAPLPPPSMSYDEMPPLMWTGLYGGLSAGYGWGSSTQSYDRNDNHGLASTDPEGAIGALTLGYNYLLTNGLLFGVEGDLGLMDLTADDKVVYDGHVYRTSFGPWWASLRGRAGVVYGNTLFYGTAGVAFMGVDEVSIGNTPGETAYNKDFRSGWVVGGGIEHAFTSRMSAKIEYLHMDFGTYEGLSDNREDFSFQNEVDLVRVGVNYKF